MAELADLERQEDEYLTNLKGEDIRLDEMPEVLNLTGWRRGPFQDLLASYSLYIQGKAMKIAATVTDLIGNTPLVHLNRLTERCGARVVAKLESANPGASVKHRIRFRHDRGRRTRRHV